MASLLMFLNPETAPFFQKGDIPHGLPLPTTFEDIKVAAALEGLSLNAFDNIYSLGAPEDEMDTDTHMSEALPLYDTYSEDSLSDNTVIDDHDIIMTDAFPLPAYFPTASPKYRGKAKRVTFNLNTSEPARLHSPPASSSSASAPVRSAMSTSRSSFSSPFSSPNQNRDRNRNQNRNTRQGNRPWNRGNNRSNNNKNYPPGDRMDIDTPAPSSIQKPRNWNRRRNNNNININNYQQQRRRNNTPHRSRPQGMGLNFRRKTAVDRMDID